MNKMILFFTLQVFINPAWAVICTRGTPYTPEYKVEVINNYGSYDPTILCKNKGFERALNDGEYTPSQYSNDDFFSLQASPNETGAHLKFKDEVSFDPSYRLGGKRWLENLKPDTACDQQTISINSDFIKNLKEISTKMNCNNAKKTTKANQKESTNIFDDTKLNKVSACVCIAQDGSPIEASRKFQDDFISDVQDFIEKEDIGGLVPVRLYQYSLDSNVLDITKLRACDELAEDKDLQEFVDKKLKKITPEARKIMGKMGYSEAIDMYNGVGRTKENYIVPIISEDAFEQFSTQWGKALFQARTSNVTGDLKTKLCEFTKSTNNQFFLDSHSISFIGQILGTQTSSKTDTPEIAVQKAYLEKMLCSYVDERKGKRLFDVLSDELSKADRSARENPKLLRSVDKIFNDTFKNVMTDRIENQCKQSHLHLSQLAKGNISAILNNDKFAEKRRKRYNKESALAERYQCHMMKQQLENNPEQFLKDFCNFNLSEGQELKSCQGIGDFLKSTFVKNSVDATSTELPSVASKVGELLNNQSSMQSTISNQAATVQVQHATTLSTIVKAATNFEGPPQNGKIGIDLEPFDISKNKSLSYTDSPTDRTNTPKSGAVQSFFEKSDSTLSPTAQNEFSTTVAPSKSFVNQQQQVFQSPIINTPNMPTTTYQANTLNTPSGINANVQPSSNPAVATTVIEKIVTPAAKNNKAEAIDVTQEAEEEIAPKKVKSKKTLDTAFEAEEIDKRATTGEFVGQKATNSSQGLGSSQRITVPSFQEANHNPSVVPENAVKTYLDTRKFEGGIVYNKDSFDSEDGVNDPTPPETGLILSAFHTGKIGNKPVKKVALEDVKDLKTFEQSDTFQGAVVIVEDKSKKERYICRALVSDIKNGAEKFLPVDANAPGKDEMAGYKCTTETATSATLTAALLPAKEKENAQKVLSGNERLYKAFVLDKIVQGVKKAK